MHPLGIYLAINDVQREHGRDEADRRRPSFAREDATPTVEPEPDSRMRRLAGALRRRVMRTAGA